MVSQQSRSLIRRRANYLCEYCHSPEYLSPDRFDVDHLLPRSLGGSDDLSNLALACRRCNQRRSNLMTGIDPKTGHSEPLFNPRSQSWNDHFSWMTDGEKVVGRTPIGRATCNRLDINDDLHHQGAIIKARRFWIQGGWHPPTSDRVLPEQE